MTDHAADDHFTWKRYWTEKLAHFAPTGILVVAAASAAMPVVSDADWFWMFNAATIGLQLALIAATTVHDFLLCTRCAARTPLDGHADADRHDRSLRWHHRPASIRLLPLLMVLTGLVATLIFDLPRGVNDVAIGLLLVSMSFDLRTWNRHRILAPWCPYCHDDRGPWDDHGPREPSPNPDPSAKSQP